MATAKDESEDVIIALEAGANDYVTKPLDFPVVMARVRTQLALKRSHEQLRHANARMKEDLDAAARVQQALIPQKAPANDRLAAAWLYRPCTELGGDIFDVVAIDDRYVAFYLVDVSGHGVPAALMSVSISRLLSHSAADSLLRNGQGAAQPAEIAGTLNRRFQMNGDGPKDGPKQYFTLVYALFDAGTGQLTFTAAGHPGPIHVCRNGKCDHLQMASFAIGWFPQAEYEQRTVTLAPGDRVYLFSDGVLDERNAGGEMFEAERLADMLQSLMSLPLQRSLDELLLELQNWNAGQPFSDDISVVALEFK
jgi:sigma-B regulation protein RsbU (phosphoserine phosphatase)